MSQIKSLNFLKNSPLNIQCIYFCLFGGNREIFKAPVCSNLTTETNPQSRKRVKVTRKGFSQVRTEFVIVLIGNPFFEMRLLNLSINFIADFCPRLGRFCCFPHYVSAKFHLWPSSNN